MGKILNILILFLIISAFFIGFGGFYNDLVSNPEYLKNQTDFAIFNATENITIRLDNINQGFEDNKNQTASAASYIWGTPLFLLNAAYNGIMIMFDLPNAFSFITAESHKMMPWVPAEIVGILNFIFIATMLAAIVYLITGKVF